MGDTHHDPCDHARTHLPHMGESMKDNYLWPGLACLAVGVLALIAGVAAAAYRHNEYLLIIGIIALISVTAGTVLVIVENRRVRRIEARWLAEHPGRLAQRVA
jgi:hypothetical protein